MRVTNIRFVDRLLDYRKVMYVCHKNADPDAVGSAYALSESFGGDICLSDGSNRVASNVIKQLEIETIADPDTDDYDLIVSVDTSTQNQIPNIKLDTYAVIDHHVTSTLLDKAEFYIHETTTSNVELIFRLLYETGIPISKKVAVAMITGIITDTGHFKHADENTFKTLSDIIRTTNVDYTEALELLAKTPQDISQRISMLAAAQRNKFERIGDTLISRTYINSYGGAAASMLTNIGADISLVGHKKENDLVRVNVRAKKEVVQKGLNLGKVMEKIGEKYDGTGGGHAGAAGVDSRTCTVNELMDECINEIYEVVGGIEGKNIQNMKKYPKPNTKRKNVKYNNNNINKTKSTTGKKVENPVENTKVNNEFNTNVNAELNTKVNNELNTKLNTKVNNELNTNVNSELNTKVNNELNTNVNAELNTKVNNELNTNVNSESNTKLNNEFNT